MNRAEKKSIQKDLTALLGRTVKIDESMIRHTTFRVGGLADVYAVPCKENFARVRAYCAERGIPFTVIGHGSNMLVGDGGIRGVVAEIGEPMSHIEVQGNVITAQAGALLSRVAEAAAAHSLTGLEFAHGIPGSVGGALVMNAGAYGGEIKDVLLSADVLCGDDVKTLPVSELSLSYRSSRIQNEGMVALSAKFVLRHGVEEDIRTKMAELKEKRLAKQPLEFPSAGSTFKRPEGHFAGKLIEDAGLRGHAIGGAQVSEKHCGFIINKGDATAADVRALIDYVQKQVLLKFDIMLEPEVRMVGEFQED